MKPIFLLLLLIAFGILFASFTRALRLFTEATLNPGRPPKRLKPKWLKNSAASLTTRSAGNSCKPSPPGKRWQSFAQF